MTTICSLLVLGSFGFLGWLGFGVLVFCFLLATCLFFWLWFSCSGFLSCRFSLAVFAFCSGFALLQVLFVCLVFSVLGFSVLGVWSG